MTPRCRRHLGQRIYEVDGPYWIGTYDYAGLAEPDAAYIAAANPAAITALLDRLAAAEAERDALLADVLTWLPDSDIKDAINTALAAKAGDESQ